MRFRLSTAAEADLEEIRACTLERWGQAQWRVYFRDLVRSFERVAAAPAAGRRRDAFRPGLRSVPCRSHVVFYVELDGGVIGIACILHARQNAEALRWNDMLGG